MQAKLYAAACAARAQAYVPYSHFAVGAAVLAEDGTIYSGCNIENASYGATVCAERVAIFKAIAAGAKSLQELCVVADTPKPVAPCGICRQVMREFKVERVYLTNCQGQSKTMTLEELLPESFGPESLAE